MLVAIFSPKFIYVRHFLPLIYIFPSNPHLSKMIFRKLLSCPLPVFAHHVAAELHVVFVIVAFQLVPVRRDQSREGMSHNHELPQGQVLQKDTELLPHHLGNNLAEDFVGVILAVKRFIVSDICRGKTLQLVGKKKIAGVYFASCF